MRRLLHHLLDHAASAYPDAVAVVDGESALTYAELDGRSRRAAATLRELGTARGDRVGLYLDKSIESVVGVYAVLRAGAAYVPLDPDAPPMRLAYITRNCGIRVLITSSRKQGCWRELASAGTPVDTLLVPDTARAEDVDVAAGMRAVAADAIDAHATDAPDVASIDLDLAYILYTSGSTGEPKGVKLSHLNALSFVEWAAQEFGVGAEDRLSSHAPLHFDLSVFDLFAAAHGAAAVVLVPPKTSVFPAQVARFIQEQRISIWYSVPSVLSMLALRGGLEKRPVPNLRTVLFAGEVFPTRYLRTLMGLLPHARFVNLYGPTETNVCTWYEVTDLPEGDEPIPIGAAIANVDVFAMTDDGTVAGTGDVGELHVRGTTVMQGYWNDAERTARVLSPNQLAPEVGDPVYRTGDLVVLGADGNYRFLGRRDAQIKSRGYRIELGDIEAALYACPDVVECAVLPVADDLFVNRIKGVVVLRDGADDTGVVAFCKSRLPAYMVPEIWERVTALPKTSTGKIDRSALSVAARSEQAR